MPSLLSSEAEARAKFAATKSADPFPEIPPALLNTADLTDYIAATGMIYPFEIPDPPEKALKPASCAIPVGGEWLYWPPTSESNDPAGYSGVLEPGQDLWLKPNSIVYVTLAPQFRIPDYIAARYNLRIKHIYRGILVGTGPLVDPGFDGQLSVPLHNLTSNPYRIRGGEPLVWMEFTKLSPHTTWEKPPANVPVRKGRYVAFPSHKLERRTVRDYVQHAHDGSIRSSIPEQIEGAREAAKSAEGQVKTFRNLSIVGALALVIGILALTYQALDFVSNTTGDNAAPPGCPASAGEVSDQREALRLCASAGGATLRIRCIGELAGS